MEQVDKKSEPAQSAQTHNKSNCWFDGEKYIPLSEMTETHLRRAKKYAQRMEEYHHHKSGEFCDKVDMLEEEAERRGIKLNDYRSRYHKNNKKFKNHIRKMSENKDV